MPTLAALQAAALEQAFVVLAQQIAARQPEHASAEVDLGPCTLVLCSGVSEQNDNVVGRFNDHRTAQLCGQFLMALDSVYQPEYAQVKLVGDAQVG